MAGRIPSLFFIITLLRSASTSACISSTAYCIWDCIYIIFRFASAAVALLSSSIRPSLCSVNLPVWCDISMPLEHTITLPEMGIWIRTLAQTSFIAWKRFQTTLATSWGRSASSSVINGSKLVVNYGLNSNLLLNLRPRCYSVKWAMPIRQSTPILKILFPPFSPTKKLALRVAILFSIWMSNQQRSCRFSSMREMSYLLIS